MRNLPTCKFCHQNNYHEGDSYHGTHEERFFYCQTDKCMGCVQYFYCYRPFCIMFWRVEDSKRCFRNFKEIGDWLNEVLNSLRISNGAKITTSPTPYCLIWTRIHENWVQAPVNERIEI